MFLSQQNLRETLRSLDKTKALNLTCNRNVHSACAMFLFTQILKKELFKYQIEFRNMDCATNFQFECNGEEFRLSNDYEAAEHCTCGRTEVVGVFVLYNVIKSMNLLRVETLWPLAVCFSYYKVFSNEKFYSFTSFADELENTENTKRPTRVEEMLGTAVCEKCREMQNEIAFSIKVLNCKSDGVFFQKRSRLEFLLGSTLSQCLKSDLRFIHEKKLFYSRGTSADRKIGEFLARRGISISSSNESYLGLDSTMKGRCSRAFGEYEKFILKIGHDIEISSVEHAFLLLFYIYKDKGIYSYMSLENRKLVDVEKGAKFYQKTVQLFKDATLTSSKTGDICIFTVKGEDLTVDQVTVVAGILSNMFRIYLAYRGDSGMRVVVKVGQDKTHCILYSEDITFGAEEGAERVGSLCVKIQVKDFAAFIKPHVIS